MQADALLVDRPRDLRLGALASLVHPVAIVSRYNFRWGDPPPDLLSRLAYLRVRLTVFLSEASARQALAAARYLHTRPHKVISGAVDHERFYPDTQAADDFRRSHDLEGRAFVLAVGALELDKRNDFLLDAIGSLGNAAPVLVICGSGSLTKTLIERGMKNGIDLRLPGHLSPAELRGAYNAAACTVHAGAIETFGLSVLEAMACGSAVVAVDGGAVPEVVGNAGLLAAVDDLAGFAGHVKRILENPTLRKSLGEAALKRATEAFSLSEMRRQYVYAIESATDQARTADLR
jgi:glycosyltransferase involved in cell wall biosynthesis